MNILLYEPKYTYARGNTIALALRKIATYHKIKKDFVVYFNKQITSEVLFLFGNKKIDLIYITTLFTYDLKTIINSVKSIRRFSNAEIKIGGIASTLMPDYVQKETGITPMIGLWEEVEKLIPDYSQIFPEVNNAMCFTTRGCIRNCGFCAVRKLEPKFHISQNWKEQITATRKAKIKRLSIQDNNFLAAPWDHQKEVIKYLSEDMGNFFEIDFNQALDCRLFTIKKGLLLSKIRIPRFRFAFDSIKEKRLFRSNLL